LPTSKPPLTPNIIPLVSLCHSIPSNRFDPWIFNNSLKPKLHLPLFNPSDTSLCPYSRNIDGDIFQCTRLCKIGAHNAIHNRFATALAPLLTTAGYLLPASKFEVKPCLYLPSDPHAWPFDLSFNPDPASPPQVNHACPYTTIGFDITISCPPPCPIFDPTSSNVTKILTANANSHLQKYKKKKLGRDNNTNPRTGITTIGNTVIGDILDQNKILLPLAINPHGRFVPILQHFLFDTPPTNLITFTQAKPNATFMYSKIMHFPSPKGVLTLANHNWKTT
jgi:hypothetical protein